MVVNIKVGELELSNVRDDGAYVDWGYVSVNGQVVELGPLYNALRGYSVANGLHIGGSCCD
jgi:hypothetical protein